MRNDIKKCFVYGCFHYVVSSSDCVALEWIGKNEARSGLGPFMERSGNSPGCTEEGKENLSQHNRSLSCVLSPGSYEYEAVSYSKKLEKYKIGEDIR
jgi:hypothetical protein